MCMDFLSLIRQPFTPDLACWILTLRLLLGDSSLTPTSHDFTTYYHNSRWGRGDHELLLPPFTCTWGVNLHPQDNMEKQRQIRKLPRKQTGPGTKQRTSDMTEQRPSETWTNGSLVEGWCERGVVPSCCSPEADRFVRQRHLLKEPQTGGWAERAGGGAEWGAIKEVRRADALSLWRGLTWTRETTKGDKGKHQKTWKRKYPF